MTKSNASSSFLYVDLEPLVHGLMPLDASRQESVPDASLTTPPASAASASSSVHSSRADSCAPCSPADSMTKRRNKTKKKKQKARHKAHPKDEAPTRLLDHLAQQAEKKDRAFDQFLSQIDAHYTPDAFPIDLKTSPHRPLLQSQHQMLRQMQARRLPRGQLRGRLSFTPEQQTAYDAIVAGRNVFLSGEAGTGKSFVIQNVIETFRSQGRKLAVTASTGIAALQIHGQTAHSFFKIPGSLQALRYGLPHHPPDALLAAETVIIDEISMIRMDVFSYICRVIELRNQLIWSEHPEAKPLQLIVVGDFFQVPPVVSRQEAAAFTELYPHVQSQEAYAFLSPFWDKMHFQTICLKQPMRQNDPVLLNRLNRIRTGDDSALTYFNQGAWDKEAPAAPCIRVCGANRSAALYNQQKLDELPGPAFIHAGIVEGKFEQDAFPAPMELELKPGALVMITRNDLRHRFVNGSMGVVVKLAPDFQPKAEYAAQKKEALKEGGTQPPRHLPGPRHTPEELDAFFGFESAPDPACLQAAGKEDSQRKQEPKEDGQRKQEPKEDGSLDLLFSSADPNDDADVLEDSAPEEAFLHPPLPPAASLPVMAASASPSAPLPSGRKQKRLVRVCSPADKPLDPAADQEGESTKPEEEPAEVVDADPDALGYTPEALESKENRKPDEPEIGVQVCLSNGKLVCVPMYQWENIAYKKTNKNELIEEVVGTYEQYPLRPAWAITIHKSQGQTFERMELLPECWNPGQLYVALSRLRSIEGLQLRALLEPRHLITSPVVIRFYQQLEEQEKKQAAKQTVRNEQEETRLSKTTPSDPTAPDHPQDHQADGMPAMNGQAPADGQDLAGGQDPTNGGEPAVGSVKKKGNDLPAKEDPTSLADPACSSRIPKTPSKPERETRHAAH